MSTSCPRCGSANVAARAAESQLDCQACGATFSEFPTLKETADGCQCVIWRQGERRCELWAVGGTSRVRIYYGDQLDVDRPFSRAGGEGQGDYMKDWRQH